MGFMKLHLISNNWKKMLWNPQPVIKHFQEAARCSELSRRRHFAGKSLLCFMLCAIKANNFTSFRSIGSS